MGQLWQNRANFQSSDGIDDLRTNVETINNSQMFNFTMQNLSFIKKAGAQSKESQATTTSKVSPPRYNKPNSDLEWQLSGDKKPSSHDSEDTNPTFLGV